MRRTLLLATLLFGCIGASSAAPIYKWVDAQGVTHFTATPPVSGQASIVPAAKQPPAAPAASAPTRSDDAGQSQADIEARVRQEVAQQEKERADYCLQLRTNLAQLRNNPRLRMEVDGEMRRLGEDERQSKISETEQAIAENCQ